MIVERIMRNMEKGKKTWKTVVAIILVIIVVAAVFLYRVNDKISKRIESLLAGATVDMTYKVALTDEADDSMQESMKLLKRFSLDEGAFVGMTDEDSLYMTLTPSGAEMELTDCYVTMDEKMLNVKAIYDYTMSVLLKDHPLVSMLVPEWGLGSYITEKQIEQIMGESNIEEENTSSVNLLDTSLSDATFSELGLYDLGISIEDMSAAFLLSAFSREDVEKIEYKDGIIDYQYYHINPELTHGMDVIAGLQPDTLFEESTLFHIIITDQSRGLQLKLRGSLTPEKNHIEKPKDIMSEEEIETFRMIKACIEKVINDK